MTRRRAAAILLLGAAAVTGCTSSVPAKPAATSTRPATPTSRPTASSIAPPADPALRRFADRLRAGVAAVRSTHFELTTAAPGQTLHGEGDETLTSAAVPDRIHLTEQLPGGRDGIELIVIGPAAYARLPVAVYRTERKWLLISSSSPTPAVRQLAATIDSARSSASLQMINQFVGAATALRRVGARDVGGTPTTHYTLTVATSRLPAGLPARDALLAIGLASIPVEIDLDRTGRPVQVGEAVRTQGQTVSTRLTLSRINRPVTIQAPPADEVGTR